MVMISMGGGEARTPSYHSMGSPRYGGCVGALLHFFDWNPGKRFYSTKRLNASKPEEGLRRSRSLRSDHGSASRTRMIFDSQPQAECEEGPSVSHGDSGRILSGDDVSSSRAPSVVARLMGLESLPKGPYQPARHRRSQSYSGAGELPFSFMTTSKVEEPPVVLQELLQRDFKASKKTLRDRMPGFAKRAQEQYENRFTKKGAALKVLRCRQDECLLPYMDIPDVEAIKSKQPFLLRLAPSTTSSPSEVSTPGIIAEFAAGWPLAGKVSLESSFRSERSSLLDSECSSSRPASTKPSKPALAIVARKIFQGRRRAGTSWNGSEDSESTSSQVEVDFRASPQHRKPRVAARDAPLKKVTKSLSPPARRDRTIRSKAATHHEASIRDFKTSGTRIPKAVQSIRASSITATSEDVDDSALPDQRQPLIQSRSRSTDFQSPVLESATSRTSSLAPASHESTSTASQASIVSPITTVPASRSKRARPGSNITRISKPDAVPTPAPPNLTSKATPLDGYRAPKVMKQNQKTGSPKRTVTPAKPLPIENANAHKGGVASSKQPTKNTLQGIQRVRVTMLTTTAPPLNDRLHHDEPTTLGNSAESFVDTNVEPPFCSRSNSTASKHSRARSIGDVFTEISPESNACTDMSVPISTEVDTKLSKPQIAASEGGCEPVFQVDLQEFLAAGADDLRWEDEEQRVGLESPELSGRFCERSCSGPSVSSASVDVSDVEDERNGDAWSSCASYNAADCDSPRAFELPDTDADECDLHEPKSTPMYVKKIKTTADGAPSQPSPVSILNSPFHDEPCTTSECTLNSDEDALTCTPQTEQPLITDPLPTSPTSTKLRQALLDISMFQSFTFSYKEVTSPKESVQGFVQELLSPAAAANLISAPGSSSPTSFDQELGLETEPTALNCNPGTIDPTTVENLLHDRLLWPWDDRKLLLDAVNEALALTAWHHWRCEEVMPGRGCFCNSKVGGEGVVEDVYAKIEEWRRLTAFSIDLLVEREMRVGGGDWKGFRAEVAAVGGEIESWIWRGVVDEVVVDLVASWNPNHAKFVC